MNSLGTLVISVYVLLNNKRSKAVRVITANEITYDDAIALYAEFKTNNPNMLKANITDASWQVNKVFFDPY